MDMVLIIKIIGASLGSSIAIVFKPGGDGWLRLVQRFVLGTIIGVISAPVITDFFEWEHSFDYWLASAALGGLLGYLFLQLVFSESTINEIKKRTQKAK